MKFSYLVLCMFSCWSLCAQEAFITTWKTDNPGSSDSNQITIPSSGESGYDYSVDWGDGTSDTGVTGSITHSYTDPGTYTVAIEGDFPRIYFNNSGDKEKILTVEQWGDNIWTTMGVAFYGCINLNITAEDAPNLTEVTNLEWMFANCESLNAPIGHWDVSTITHMSGLFSYAISFDQPLDDWDVSQVTEMRNMFSQCFVFDKPIGSWDVSSVRAMSSMFSAANQFNQPLNSWDVSQVTDMSSMFHSARAFNQPIGTWNVSQVTTMISMFNDAASFNQNISDWNVSQVTFMSGMFQNAKSFNQDISSWDVSQVNSMASMFEFCDDFNQPINSWDVSNVTDMSEMFRFAISFDQPLDTWDVSQVNSIASMFEICDDFNQPINSWDVSNVTDMSKMFRFAISFDQPLDSWDVSKVTNMSNMFDGAYSFNKPLGNWDVSAVADMNSMFSQASAFNQPLNTWDVSVVTNMNSMFYFATQFNQPLSSWDVSAVTNMTSMFNTTIFDQDIGTWEVGNVTNMSAMFIRSNFDQDISQWDVSRVENMEGMFDNANGFDQDLSSWDVSSVANMSRLFSNSSYNQDISGWDVSQVTDMSQMFFGASSFDQDLSSWNISQVADMTEMFWAAGSFSAINYDKLLIAWSELSEIQSGVVLDAELNYCLGESGRSKLINDYGWIISEDQKSCGPQLAIAQTFTVSENTADGQIAGIVKASDPDGDFSFSISGGNVQDAFAIDASSGELSVFNSEALDYEEIQFFELEVEVTDGEATDTAVVKVFLINEFDTPFVSTWKTDEEGDSEDNQITIPTMGEGYNYTVDWGDGNSDSNVTGTMTHTYAEAGVYQVTIDGDFPQIYFNYQGDRNKILSIDQWHDRPLRSMELAFAGCENLTIKADNVPNLTEATSLEKAFAGAILVSEGFRNWDVSHIENFTGMFLEAISFNDLILYWDMSNAQLLTSMFAGATSFSSSLDFWDVSKVVDMSGMFSATTSFNRKGLDNWNVLNVVNMSFMFSGAVRFNEDLSSWNITSVVDMTGMFDQSGLQAVNYDQMLIKWSQQNNLQDDVVLGARNVAYCQSEEARSYLIDEYGWSFTGHNLSCDPQINPQFFYQPEHEEFDTLVGTVQASNPDGDDFSFSIISGNEDGLYDLQTVDSDSEGTIRLMITNPSILDYEVSPTDTLEIEVRDEEGNTDSAEMIVFVLPVNEVPVFEEKTFRVQFPNNDGTVIGTLMAIDPENDNLTFTLLAVDGTFFLELDNQPFQVDSISGEISVARADLLNYSQHPAYVIAVQVTDGSLRETGIFDITVDNVLSTGLESTELIYPNPTTDLLTIDIPMATNSEFKVTVQDLHGKTWIKTEGSKIIDVAHLIPGMYLLHVYSGGTYGALKFIKR